MRTYDDTMFIDTFEHEYTWLSGFMRNVARFSGKTALIDPESKSRWTYASLNEEANRLANALQTLGLKKNDVVMAALRNSPEFAFAYIGPRKIGAILLASHVSFAAVEFALLMNHNKPQAVIYDAEIAPVISEAQAIADWKPKIFIFTGSSRKKNQAMAGSSKNHISYEDFTKKASPKNPEISFRPHIYDEVLRFCTSGTSALPKLVPINDINEVLSAHDVIMHYPLTPNDVTMNMTPWFHRGGSHAGGLCPTLYVGASAVIMRKFQPANTLDWVEKFKITFLTGSPPNLAYLSRAQEKSRRNLASLKGLVTMGAPLSKSDCMRYMSTLTPNIFNCYGTTETFWNSFLRPYNLPEGAGSVGLSCTDDEVRVVRIQEGSETAPEECVAQDNATEGEIIIKAPGKSTCTYINEKSLSAEKFQQGWLYTGDTGVWNEKGIVTVLGRKDDMIITSGENIYPAQIEEVLESHPKVMDSIVTSIPDSVRGQAIVAYVVPADKSLTIRELFDFCTENEKLSLYKRPRYFALIDEIPLTATGKKRHSEMKARAVKDLEAGLLKKD